MATRYWVGGDGNWSDGTNHWSNTSGGTPNIAYTPSSADDVIFDANSNVGTGAFVVTVDGTSTTPSLCQDFSTSSLDGSMTLTMGATAQLDCYGSMTLPATNLSVSATTNSTLVFASTSTGKTVTTNGVSLSALSVNFDGVGGAWTLGSALTLTNPLRVINGTFSTNNFNITGAQLATSGTGTKVINLGSSTTTLSAATAVSMVTTNLTFNAGTSTIICSNVSPTFAGGGLTFYNVEFSGGAGTKTITGANTFSGQFLVSSAASTVVTFSANQTFTGGAQFSGTTQTVNGNFTYTGTMQFNSAAVGVKTIGGLTIQNLTVTVPAVDGTTTLSLNANLTITGTLTTTNGGSTSRRVLLNSTSSGTQRTLSVGTNSLINTDFQDIAAAGTASWVFGPGYGNLGGNSGITFNSSALYWIGGTGSWSDGTKWSTSSGGAAANAIPMQQNSVVFDQNSNVGTGTFTVTVDGTSAAPSLCNDFSTSSLDGAMTLATTATTVFNCYGSMTLPATNFTWSGTTGASLTFNTSGSATLTTNGVSLSNGTVTLNQTGTLTFGSAITTAGVFAFTSGTLTTSNFNLSCTSFLIQLTSTKTANLGSSTITCTAAGGLQYTGSNLTFNAGTSTINCSNASPTFAGGGLTFYNVGFTSTAIATATITGANIYNNLSFTARAAAGIGFVNFDAGVTNTVNGTLTLGSGTTGNTRLLVRSNTIGTAATLSVATLTAITDIDFRDITAAGASSPWSGTRIGNCLNNTNITFTAARTVYWVSAASANWNGNVWNTTSGTTGGSTANFPLAQDSIVIDNAGLTAGNTITINAAYQIPNLSFATRSTAATFATGTASPVFYGDLTYSSSVTPTGTGTFTFAKQGATSTITSANVTFTQLVTINSANGTVRINGNLTLGSTLTTTLTTGTLDLTNGGAGNYTLSTGLFSSSNSNTRAITFGTGNITLTGSGATIWTTATATNFSYTGTPTVNATYSGSTGTRTLTNGNTTGGSETNAVSFFISAGSDIVTFGSSRIKNLVFTGFSGSWTNSAIAIFGNLTISSGMTCTAGANAITFQATSGTQQLTTNGQTLDFPITQNSPGATLQLQDNLTIVSTRAFTLTAGTLDLSNGNRTLSCGQVSSSNSNTRSILFGTGNITVTGSGISVFFVQTADNLTYTGTPTVNCTYSGSVGQRTIQFGGTSGGTETNCLNFNITAGSDIFQITGGATGSAAYGNINFTGFTGSLNSAGNIRTLYKNIIFSSGMTFVTPSNFGFDFKATSGTQQITTNGITIYAPLSFSGTATYQFQDALTQEAGKAFTITSGTVQLKASTTNVVGSLVTTTTATKALQSTIPGTRATISQASGDVYADYITIKDSAATGGANFYATAASNGGNNTGWNFATNFYYWVGGDGNWSDAAAHWSNSSGGSPSASYLPTAADIVIFDANSNSGTSAFNVTVDGTSVSPSLCNDFVCGTGVGGGALDGAMTLSLGSTGYLDCYGSMTLPATNLTWSGGGRVQFQATTTGKTITTNGVTLTDTFLAFFGVGGGWTLGSAITTTISGLAFANGTFSTNNYNITSVGLQKTAAGTATLNLGSSAIALSG